MPCKDVNEGFACNISLMNEVPRDYGFSQSPLKSEETVLYAVRRMEKGTVKKRSMKKGMGHVD
jgi:hypothetical protein